MLDTTTTALTLTAPASEEITTMAQAQALGRALTETGLTMAWVRAKDPETFYRETLVIASKADYLAFKAALKSWLRAMANGQRIYKDAMHQRGGDSAAQMRAHNAAHAITILIEIRRAARKHAGIDRAANAA